MRRSRSFMQTRCNQVHSHNLDPFVKISLTLTLSASISLQSLALYFFFICHNINDVLFVLCQSISVGNNLANFLTFMSICPSSEDLCFLSLSVFLFVILYFLYFLHCLFSHFISLSLFLTISHCLF